MRLCTGVFARGRQRYDCSSNLCVLLSKAHSLPHTQGGDTEEVNIFVGSWNMGMQFYRGKKKKPLHSLICICYIVSAQAMLLPLLLSKHGFRATNMTSFSLVCRRATMKSPKRQSRWNRICMVFFSISFFLLSFSYLFFFFAFFSFFLSSLIFFHFPLFFSSFFFSSFLLVGIV